ncbi:MAG: Rrf2 family transcriptional regulator [Candidatus Omnitrophota bacterium]|nr:MAG: Rrf2 family transcriptional regulator [Candidatus Omnitrophota bacterium]
MIHLTTTLSYGLRFLANLALAEGRPKRLSKIAKEESISLLYLRKLIIPLEKAGIMKSVRGPGGGFVLSRNPSEIRLSEVISILSRNRVMECLKTPSSCLRQEDCRIKGLLEEVYNKIQGIFENKTLETIIKR